MAQLHHGIGFLFRFVRVGESYRLQGAVAQRVGTAFGHDLNGQAALEIGRLLELLELRLVSGQQEFDERVVLRLVEWAIDVVGSCAARTDLVVARLPPTNIHVDGLEMHNRRNCIEESEFDLAGEVANGLGQSLRSQGAGGDDHARPVRGRKIRYFAAHDLDERMLFQGLGDGVGKSVTIHGQGATGGKFVRVRRRHDDGAGAPHLLVQETDRICFEVVGSERIGANELSQAAGLVGFRPPLGAHLVKDDRHARLRELPGRFAARKAAANNVNGFNHARS